MRAEAVAFDRHWLCEDGHLQKNYENRKAHVEILASLISMDSPKPQKRPVVTALHGIEWTDDYAWLREKENPEVIQHLEAENAYCAAAMESTSKLQETLYAEILGRIQQTDLTVPARHGDY